MSRFQRLPRRNTSAMIHSHRANSASTGTRARNEWSKRVPGARDSAQHE